MKKQETKKNRRTHAQMTNWEIKKQGIANGYYACKAKVECPVCKEEMEKAIKAIGYTKTKPVWVNVVCALKMYKKGFPIIEACPCGWRRTRSNSNVPNTGPVRTYCATPDCPAILTPKDTNAGHTNCTKCRNNAVIGIPVKRAFVTCKCGAVLPSDRKRHCYKCIPRKKAIVV